MTDPTKPHICVCGAVHRIRVSKHSLHAGLVDALKKFADRAFAKKARGDKFWNAVHIRRELDLDRDQWTNFSKLKWLGLVTQFDRFGKPLNRGYWALTTLGDKFLRGEVKI